MTEDEMVGWHHCLNGCVEQVLGDGEGQGSLVCCSPWAREESDTAEQPNDNNKPLREPSAMCRGVTLTSGDQEPPLRVGPPLLTV